MANVPHTSDAAMLRPEFRAQARSWGALAAPRALNQLLPTVVLARRN